MERILDSNKFLDIQWEEIYALREENTTQFGIQRTHICFKIVEELTVKHDAISIRLTTNTHCLWFLNFFFFVGSFRNTKIPMRLIFN